MAMSKLDNEEQELLDAFESGQLKPSKSAKNIQDKHQSYAEAMLKRMRV